MRKLDVTKNSEEVAFAFFKYAMTLDLANFNVHDPYQTQLHHEQNSHNKCALKCFLEAVRSGEFRCAVFCDDASQIDSHMFTHLQLMGHFKEYIKQSGLYTNIESTKGLGWALKKYPTYVRKVEGRAAKYVIEVNAAAGNGK